MGFSHDKTAHHFHLTPEGGLISASATDAADVATRDAIRQHLQHIAKAFSAGDFSLPMFIHGQEPPGASTMKRLSARITYTSEDTPSGAQVVIRTRDAEALKAVHSFLQFQIREHRTGDSAKVVEQSPERK